MCCDKNVITMKMPVKKEYSQILRLTASGAFNQAGFDLDVIEDVKVVVSEVLNCLLESKNDQFEVSFVINEDNVSMEFSTCDGSNVLEGANDMTLPILEALVTKVESKEQGNLHIIVEKEMRN